MRAVAGNRVCSLDPAERREADGRIHARLLAVAAEFQHSTLLAYRALRDEVGLDPFLCEMAERGWAVYLPRVAEPGILRVARWRPGSAMTRDSTGVPAPDGVPLENPRDLGGLALVPGRIFDLRGGRVGRGGGYYDRLLADGGAQWFSVGIAYECQVMEAVPLEAHDRRMDALVTERCYREFGKAGEKGEQR